MAIGWEEPHRGARTTYDTHYAGTQRVTQASVPRSGEQPASYTQRAELGGRSLVGLGARVEARGATPDAKAMDPCGSAAACAMADGETPLVGKPQGKRMGLGARGAFGGPGLRLGFGPDPALGAVAQEAAAAGTGGEVVEGEMVQRTAEARGGRGAT